MIYNPNEIIEIPKIGMIKVSIPHLPILNVFGNVDRAYDIVETDTPYLLMENGVAMLWEDGSKILLEQQTKKVWRPKARK